MAAASGGSGGPIRTVASDARKPGHGAAQKLPAKRHTQKLEGKKLPENLRTKTVTFRELCDDALVHSQSENSEKQTYELRLRINQLLAEFGSRSVESIKKRDIVGWLAEQAEARAWAASSRNRWQATFSLIFRVGIDNEKIDRNPAARIRRKTEGGGRVRFLSDAEEVRLRAAIEQRFREFLPHFLLSIHTGMRMSEQYSLDWSQVDVERRQIHLPKTKNGDPRTIPLNAIALTALKYLDGRGKKMRPTPVFPSIRTGESLQGSRGWFPSALEEAKIEGYTWHCNRHTFASRLVNGQGRSADGGRAARAQDAPDGHAVLPSRSRAPGVGCRRLVKAGNRRDTKTDTRRSAAKAIKHKAIRK
jgi:integrase